MDENLIFSPGYPGKRMGNKIVRNEGKTFSREPIQIKGLAASFARLTTSERITVFSAQFGLLGVAENRITEKVASVLKMPWFANLVPNYALTMEEPISLWNHHVRLVRKLLVLYRALDRYNRGQGSNLLELIVIEKVAFGWIAWYYDSDIGSEHIALPFTSRPTEELAAFHILAHYIKTALTGGINLDFAQVVKTPKSKLGFRINEIRTTPFLLAAIYYDLWQIVTDNRAIAECLYCGGPMEKHGKKKYCGGACRQAAYRRRKEKEENSCQPNVGL